MCDFSLRLIVNMFFKDYDFQCLGSWEDSEGNVWSAVTDRGEDIERDRYRCLVRLRYSNYYKQKCFYKNIILE